MHLLILLVFVIGYFAIVLEHPLKLNKAASALLTGMLCWTIYILFTADKEFVTQQLHTQLSEVSGILFFLLGAMTIVELIDAHNGFEVITDLIRTRKKRTLMWVICGFAFLLSAILDNLTTTIVLVSLLRKVIPEKEDRMLFVGMVVVAANAGGAWSPIGDVTTTMLWIGGQITAMNIIAKLILPSLVCLCVPLIWVSFQLKGTVGTRKLKSDEVEGVVTTRTERNVIFFSGLFILLGVPVFKTITHLPPLVGMLLGLGIMWLISDIIHKDKAESDKNSFSVLYALRKIDTPSLLFFLGILLAIGAIQATGQLRQLSLFMDEKIGNINAIVLIVGLLSSIIDNVPLVAAAMGMYDMHVYPADHYFWEFLAYSTGTGGSTLIIGSAAGVVAMGMERISFFWYLKKISLLALAGYFAGAVVYILQHAAT